MPANDLVAIPGLTIDLRDARTQSSRTVELVPFAIGAVPVTRDDGTRIPMHPMTWFGAVEWCNTASRQAGLHPAYTVSGREVSWDVAADGFRLPTEAEWEAACRAGTNTPTYGPLEAIAWTAADDVAGPQAVALKEPNAFGLFDTLGNIWEWCWDYADTARYNDYRSLRGGGWADQAWSCRASVRRGSAPDAVLEDVGFRVARGAVGEPGANAAQGWSAASDRERAAIAGALPVGWTPLRGL